MKWAKAKLETLAADVPYALVGGPFGSKLTTQDYVEEGIPVIRGSNMSRGRYLDTAEFVYVTEGKLRKDLFGCIALPNDLVFTQRGTLGQVAIVPEGGPSDRYVISQSQMKLTVDGAKADRSFLYYYFTSREAIQKIQSHTSSSGVPHINLGTLRSFEVPLPPLLTQKAIAKCLTLYDDLIEINRRRIQLLEESARQMYREWFIRLRFPGHEHVKIRDGVPEGWTKTQFGKVCDAIGGGTPSTANPSYWENGDVTWVIPTDVTRNDCLALLDSEKKITESGLRESSAKLVPPFTILMTSRASVGFFALADQEVCTNQGFISVVPHSEWHRMFLLYNLMSRVEEIRAHAAGSTYPEISKGRFRQLPILVPSRPIAEEFGRSAFQLHTQVRNLKRQQVRLAQARDLLLPRLMNGDIPV